MWSGRVQIIPFKSIRPDVVKWRNVFLDSEDLSESCDKALTHMGNSSP